MYLGMGPRHTTVVAVAHEYPTVHKPNATQPQIPTEPQPPPRVPKRFPSGPFPRAFAQKTTTPRSHYFGYWYAVSYGDTAIYIYIYIYMEEKILYIYIYMYIQIEGDR